MNNLINIMWLKVKLWLSNPAQNLWVQPALGALFAIGFSALASITHYVIPERWLIEVGALTLSDLLDIISGSMLAVSTFSLSIMVSALVATSSSISPRARILVMSDASTRLAITSFITAFIYAVIAKISLELQLYGAGGRLVMFVGTLIVLMYLIFTLIRWVQTLSNLGSLLDTVEKIETAVKAQLATYRQHPQHGITGIKPSATPKTRIFCPRTGYLTHIEFELLNDWCQENRCHIHIALNMNEFAARDDVLFDVYAKDDCTLDAKAWANLDKKLNEFAIISSAPSHQSAPLYGIQLLAEIAERALSPAVNDPTTAFQTVSVITHLLADVRPASDGEALDYAHLSIVPFCASAFIQPYYPLARDGVGHTGFIIHMLHCLHIIHRTAPEFDLQEAAVLMAERIYLLAQHHTDYDAELDRLSQAWRSYFGHLPLPTNRIKHQ